MHLWIDDERVEPKGWLRVSDCANAIAALELYAYDMDTISFDYDIGLVGNGGDVAQYLKDNWKYLGMQSTVKFNIHSGNPTGTERTKKILEEIYTVWDRQDRVTTKSAKEIIGGPIMIGKFVGDAAAQGWLQLWSLIAALSAILAFFNILPIPALDGGHLMFLLIEGISGRPLSTKTKLVIQQVGMAILLTLIIFILYIDLQRLL